MIRLCALVAAALALAGAAPADPRADDAAALEALLGHQIEGEGMRLVQNVAIEGCDVTVTATVRADPGGERRVEERSRLEIEHFEPVEIEGSTALDLTARRYFSQAGDRGLTRWLAALAETRDDPDRSARMREIQRDVEAGAYGDFAIGNGYESRSFLEGDPEPYYAMPLPALALVLPDGTKPLAETAWVAYAERYCLNTAEP